MCSQVCPFPFVLYPLFSKYSLLQLSFPVFWCMLPPCNSLFLSVYVHTLFQACLPLLPPIQPCTLAHVMYCSSVHPFYSVQFVLFVLLSLNPPPLPQPPSSMSCAVYQPPDWMPNPDQARNLTDAIIRLQTGPKNQQHFKLKLAKHNSL